VPGLVTEVPGLRPGKTRLKGSPGHIATADSFSYLLSIVFFLTFFHFYFFLISLSHHNFRSFLLRGYKREPHVQNGLNTVPTFSEI